ncbi:MAG: hypothetical protein KJ607_10240 [Bacteroidetes bacterium]|nr:hypothetical protein [Bacteroidota bacterium]
MIDGVENKQICVFLPWTTTDELYRLELKTVLEKAGMQVVPEDPLPENEEDFIYRAGQALTASNCSVHVLSIGFGKTLSSDPAVSYPKYQFYEARKKTMDNSTFRMFIWQPPHILGLPAEERQQHFINEIRYNIGDRMSFTNAASSILLAEDIRAAMSVRKHEQYEVNDTDVFMIYNEVDEYQAEDVIDLLTDVVDVQKLNIIQDRDINYPDYCSQQISRSKLAVVYFKETAGWALPFTQQVWKIIGGASAGTPILLIGDEDPDTNRDKLLKAPKIISMVVSGELIPLEIKVQYDKVAEAS